MSRVRCSSCGARRTLGRALNEYTSAGRVPACGKCKGRKYRVDRYRTLVELKVRPCQCRGGYYTFPHRRGSKWCEYNTSWTTADAQAAFGTEEPVPARPDWIDDPFSFGQEPQTGEDPPF